MTSHRSPLAPARSHMKNPLVPSKIPYQNPSVKINIESDLDSMNIRDATPSDFHAMAEVMAMAFTDDELFGELMHPHRAAYPEDFITFFERTIWSHWYDYNRKFLVSVDKESGRILGAAQWERQGKGGGLSKFDPRNLLSPIAALTVRASSWMWPNRAADPARANILDETAPLCAHNWEGARQENWYLDILAVHPDGQGNGIGKELVQWGLDAAKKEGVPASVISAFKKDGFYRKCGFVEVARANVGAMKEAGIQGGAIMFTGVEDS